MSTLLELSKEDATMSKTRTTRDGRKITYCMKVVQQPERARACGQGAKSSTDRRPVDPPPIIDLRIFEGEGANEKDVTFSYRANFFVWASLEQARPIAQGRVAQDSAFVPVLCGTPVAGISYLERPQPAGYFIFPDLSVRHEGKYIITFTLYEDSKDPRYEDPEPKDASLGDRDQISGRCEIKSVPFIVYSAKKFPGLAESTALSRLVADQGCRVRIRRDVRMRRRENTGTKDWDDYDEATSDQRARHASTPHGDAAQYPQGSIHPSPAPSGEQPALRRSNSIASNVSVHHQPTHSAVNEWAPQDVAHAYQQMGPGGTPVPAQPSTQYYRGPSNHEPATIAPYPTPQYVNHSPMPPSPQPMSNPHMSPYNMASTWGYGHQPHVQSPGYVPAGNHLRHQRMSYVPASPEYSAPPSHQQYHGHSYASTPSAGESSGYGRPLHTPYPSGSQAPMMATAPTQNVPSFSASLPPLRAPNNGFDRGWSGSATSNINPPPGGYVPPPLHSQYFAQTPTGTSGLKRPYGSVFDPRHISEPLRKGARLDVKEVSPQTGPGFEGSSDPSSSDDDSNGYHEQLQMEYRRADGTKVLRRWPQS